MLLAFFFYEDIMEYFINIYIDMEPSWVSDRVYLGISTLLKEAHELIRISPYIIFRFLLKKTEDDDKRQQLLVICLKNSIQSHRTKY